MNIYDKIREERERQEAIAYGGDTAAFDKTNTHNDWVSYITAYAGRATDCHRNERDQCDFSESLIKVGALVVAALEEEARRNEKND